YQQAQWQNARGAPRTPPGRKVLDTIVPVRGAADEMAETRIDLGPALPEKVGHLVVVVEPDPKEGTQSATHIDVPAGPQRVVTWVEATRIGVSAFVDESELVAWTTVLADGAPLGGVSLE